MRKIIPVLLLCALLLSGCGLTEQAAQVKEEYIDPAIRAAQTGESVGTASEALGPDVTLDRTSLTDFTPVGSVYTRLSVSEITALTPSGDYGTLVPFVEAYAYGEDGRAAAAQLGLATEDGAIVLDARQNYLARASYADDTGAQVWQKIYVLGRAVADETAENGVSQRYAVCGLDGAWTTDFLYSAVYPMAMGVLCVRDGEKNLAVCYDESGAVVFDTQSFSSLSGLESNSIDSLADCGSSLMLVRFSDGRKGFVDAAGAVLNRYAELPSRFDDALPFSDGLAAVSSDGAWGYLKPDGTFAVNRQYDSAGSFVNGIALVQKDGVYRVIDQTGTELKVLDGAQSAALDDTCLAVTAADGTVTRYTVPGLAEMSIYDIPAQPFDGGYWVKGQYGVRAMTDDGTELYFSGGSALTDAANGLYLIELTDGGYAAMDGDGRAVAVGGALTFVRDTVTGTAYICDPGDGDGARLYDGSGALVAEDVLLAADGTQVAFGGPADGLVPCADDYSAGWKSGGSWVFRLKLDAGD